MEQSIRRPLLMDRNAITGIVLITVLTLVYFTFFAPKPEDMVPQTPRQTTQADPGTPSAGSNTPPPVMVEGMDEAQQDSVETLRRQRIYSDFYRAAQGEDKTFSIQTEKLTVELTSLGGAIGAAYLNEYKTHDSLPLPAISADPNNEFYFQFYFEGAEGKTIKSSDLYFLPTGELPSQPITGTDSAVVVMRASIDENRYVEQRYTLYGDRYDLGYDIVFHGLEDRLGKYASYELNWVSNLAKTEYSVKNMRQKTTIAYRQGEEVEKLKEQDDRIKEEIKTPVDWVSYKSQFFSSILIPDQPFHSANLTMATPYVDSVNRIMSLNAKVDWQRSDDIVSGYRFYLGPNEFYTLNSYNIGLQKEMDLGWWIISYINIGTTYVFKFFEGFVSNYGIIIILLAILIRLLILPMTFKSYVSMAKMRVLNSSPEMKSLDEKYKDDAQKLQMAKMSIFREMGVSPLGGCLPMLFSYPFLIALFFFFPQAVELRQQSFLWANDLSTFDAVISWKANIPLISSVYGNHISLFTLLMAISTFFYTWYQQKSQPTQANPALKYVAYILPFFLLIFLNNYASGLSLYYLTSNILSIAQNAIIGRFVDDEKLLAEMRNSQKKGKKGEKAGGGKSRLESWMEKQQKKQQELLRERQAKSAAPKNRQERRNK